MRGAASLTKIGALFFAAVIFTAVSNSRSAYAQNRGVEISDTLVVSFTVDQGSRKTAVLQILDTLVVRFSDSLGSVEDLAAAVATSDQILWSCRA